MATKVATIFADLTLKDSLTPGLKKAEGTLDKTAKKADQTGKSVESMGQKFAGAAKHASAFSLAFLGVAKAADELKTAGESAKRSELALTKLSGSAQEAERWIAAVKDASMGTVTTGEAAAQAYQLMQFGLAQTSEEAQEFVRSIAIVASVNPQLKSTGEAINEVQLTLANMSFPRLDQLGISAGVVRARMKELKDETASLSKEEAFSIAVKEELTKQSDLLGDELLEVGNASERMKARFRESKEDIGLWISEGIEPAIEGVLGFSDAIDEFGVGKVITVSFELLVKDISESRTGEIADQIARGVSHTFEKLTGTGDDPEIVIGTTGEADAWLAFLESENVGADIVIDVPTASQIPIGGRAPQASQIPIGGRDDSAIIAIDDLTAELVNNTFSVEQFGASIRADNPLASALRTAGAAMKAGQGRTTAPPKGTQAQTDFGITTAQDDLFAGMGGKEARDPLGLVGETPTQAQTTGLPSRTGPTEVSRTEMFEQVFAANDGMRALVANTNAFIDAIESARPTSLAEKFGLDAGSFDTDVFRAMQDALNGVETEGTAAADALQLYQLQTGMATGSSELFSAQMDTLAQQLADGTISAEAYVAAVTDLGQSDLSFADDLISRMVGDGASIDAVNAMIDKLSTTDTTGFNLEGLDKAANALKGIGLFGGGATEEEGGALEEASPIQVMIDEAVVLEESMSTAMDPALEDMANFEKSMTTLTAESQNIGIVLDISTDPANATVLAAWVVAELERQGLAVVIGGEK